MSYYIYYDTQRRAPHCGQWLDVDLVTVQQPYVGATTALLLLRAAAVVGSYYYNHHTVVGGAGGGWWWQQQQQHPGDSWCAGRPRPSASTGTGALCNLPATCGERVVGGRPLHCDAGWCYVPDARRRPLKLHGCRLRGRADAAAGVVVPAAQAPTGHTTLYFAFTCMCEVHRGTQVYNIWAPPTVAQLDLTTLHAKKVCDTPATLFNTHTQDFVTVGWSSGSGGRLLVSAPMYSPTPAGEPAADEARITTGTRTGATPPNSTVVYVHIDPHSGTVLGKVDGPTRCEACSDQGLMPVLGVGLSAANFSLHVRPFVRVVGGRTTDGTTELVAIDSSTGVVVFNVSMPLDWISWSVEEASGDVVGLGSCLCLASAATPHCPAGTLRTARPPCSSPHACCGLLLPRHTGAGGDDINFSIRTD
jgi:hypothetical protein